MPSMKPPGKEDGIAPEIAALGLPPEAAAQIQDNLNRMMADRERSLALALKAAKAEELKRYTVVLLASLIQGRVALTTQEIGVATGTALAAAKTVIDLTGEQTPPPF